MATWYDNTRHSIWASDKHGMSGLNMMQVIICRVSGSTFRNTCSIGDALVLGENERKMQPPQCPLLKFALDNEPWQQQVEVAMLD